MVNKKDTSDIVKIRASKRENICLRLKINALIKKIRKTIASINPLTINTSAMEKLTSVFIFDKNVI